MLVASKALLILNVFLTILIYSVFGPGWLYWQPVRTSPDWPEQSRLITQKATQPKLSEEHGRVEWIRALHRHGGFIRTCLELQGKGIHMLFHETLNYSYVECDIEDNINMQKCCHLYNRWLICEWHVCVCGTAGHTH